MLASMHHSSRPSTGQHIAVDHSSCRADALSHAWPSRRRTDRSSEDKVFSVADEWEAADGDTELVALRLLERAGDEHDLTLKG